MATKAKTRHKQDTAGTPTLFLAFELGVSTWRLGFTTGAATTRAAGAGGGDPNRAVEIGRAKQRFGLPEQTRVVSCYEPGWVLAPSVLGRPGR